MHRDVYLLTRRLEDEHWWWCSRRELFRGIVNSCDCSGRLVCEVGCGTGGNLAGLSQVTQVIGIDPSRDAVEIARERLGRDRIFLGEMPSEIGIDLVRQSALLLLADVLEHVPDDRDVLARWVDVLPMGAYILITVPADMRLWSQHDEVHGHRRRYDEHTLRCVWRDLPVEPVLVAGFNWTLYPVIYTVRAWNRWRRRRFGTATTDLWMPPGWINATLRRLLSGESKAIQSAIRRGEDRLRPHGAVSLLAVLRRTSQAAIDKGRCE